MLEKIAFKVSEYTGVDLKVTDPIVGTGVNSISTGTPFVDTKSFQPFDPKTILDINKKILVTQLASARVIKEAGDILGYSFTDDQIKEALEIIKHRAYELNRAITPKKELIEIFDKVTGK
ncbi:MAG: hypothetical protein HC831_00685 [Chloroflexia bacterium]|nr:hypothetical protein [Chloroflexia bacterium]